MIQKLFSIYDSKAGAFLPHWPAPNVAVAVRLFQEGCLIESSPYFKHPGDYTLTEIGTFDQELGLLAPCTHIDHGTALIHKSRALLERDYYDQQEDDEQRVVAGLEPHKHALSLQKPQKYGKTITNGDALRSVSLTKETTP